MAVLGEMKVKGERRWVIADAELGQVSIPQGWTEECAAAEATSPAAAGRYLVGLLQLAQMVQTLQETHQAKEQAHVFRATTDPAADHTNEASPHTLAPIAGNTSSPTDCPSGDLATTAVATDAAPGAATSNRGGGA